MKNHNPIEFDELLEKLSDSDVFDTPGIYGRTYKEIILDLLQSRRELETIGMKAYYKDEDYEQSRSDAEQEKFQLDYMAEVGMPENDFQDYLENRKMGDIDNSAKEIGMNYKDLDDWLADNWDRPEGEERWGSLSELL